MIWYVAPMVTVTITNEEKQTSRTVTGPGDGSGNLWKPSTRVRRYVHAYDTTAETCLVGFERKPSGVPSSWTSKTLAEAKDHFETVTGRSPSDKEVF